jgi:hypothetical protein
VPEILPLKGISARVTPSTSEVAAYLQVALGALEELVEQLDHLLGIGLPSISMPEAAALRRSVPARGF